MVLGDLGTGARAFARPAASRAGPQLRGNKGASFALRGAAGCRAGAHARGPAGGVAGSAPEDAGPRTSDLTWSGETDPLSVQDPPCPPTTRPLGGRPGEAKLGQAKIKGGKTATTHPRRGAARPRARS